MSLKSVLKIFLFVCFTGCTTLSEIDKDNRFGVFSAPYNIVWQAVLLSMKNYPFRAQNREGGQIETKLIKGYNIWQPPKGAIRNLRNREYLIKIFLERGFGDLKEEAIRVRVLKEEYINKDFVQQAIPIPTNGLEEEIILYRISREIFLQKEKERFFKKRNERQKK